MLVILIPVYHKLVLTMSGQMVIVIKLQRCPNLRDGNWIGHRAGLGSFLVH